MNPHLIQSRSMHERNGKSLTICLVAGDVSGDQNGSRLAHALLDLEPGLRLMSVGGAALRRSGVEVTVDNAGVFTIGPPDSLQALRSLSRVWRGARSLFRTARLGRSDRRRNPQHDIRALMEPPIEVSTGRPPPGQPSRGTMITVG